MSSVVKQQKQKQNVDENKNESAVFDVLYGKKKKNKGGSFKAATQCDGILTIFPPPSSLVTLVDATEAIGADEEATTSNSSSSFVYRGVQKEIAKRCFSRSGGCSDGGEGLLLQVDDLLVVGPYEVEILAIRGGSDDMSSTKIQTSSSQQVKTSSNQYKRNIVSKPLLTMTKRQPLLSSQRPKQLQSQQRPQSLSRKPLHPPRGSLGGAVSGGSNQGNSGSSFKVPLQRPTKPVPKSAAKDPVQRDGGGAGGEHSDSEDSSSKDDGEEETESLPQHSVPGSRLLKRPFVSPAATIAGGSTRQRLVQGFQNPSHRKRPAAVLSASISKENSCTPSSSTTTMTTTNPSHPVAHIDLPHSVRSVLKPHQEEGVSFLWKCLTGKGVARPRHSSSSCSDDDDNDNDQGASHRGAILADEMGLGKTLMTIAVICAMYRQQRNARFVIVCPSSLVVNWAKEFDKWLGKVGQPKRVICKDGGEDGVRKIRSFCAVKPHSQSEILIISYDLFRRQSGTNIFRNLKKVGLLCVDEGHRLKNTKGSLTLSALESLPCEARLCITATPIQNILSDFYNIANFVCPGVLGDLSSFRREFERPISSANHKNASAEQASRGLAQSQALEEITRTFMIRRFQKDVLKSMLPPRDEILLFCRPTEEQCTLYQELTSAQRGGPRLTGATADALTTLINLRKLCAHPQWNVVSSSTSSSTAPVENVDSDFVARSGKLMVLNSLLASIRKHAPNDKIVIISNFTSALSLIQDSVLRPQGLTYQRLDGSTELSQRHGIVDTFNKTSASRNFAFLLSSKAGGCGLNLIGANRLVMFDPDWNPASDAQAMARIYRTGQDKRCSIYRFFTSGTVEEVVYQRQIQKGNLVTLTVDIGLPSSNSGSSSTGFTKEELKDCFTLKEGCDCDTKRKVGQRWHAYGTFSYVTSNIKNGSMDVLTNKFPHPPHASDGTRAGLASQGCVDEPLLALASSSTSPTVSNPLGFVRVVDEDHAMPLPKDDSMSSRSPSKATKNHDDSDDESTGQQNDSSSDEEEFEFGYEED